MKALKAKKKYLKLSLFTLYYVSFLSYSADGNFAEFDPSFIQGYSGKSKIDVNQFNYGNPINAGNYDLDVIVNGKYRGHMTVNFGSSKEGKDDATSLLCLTPELVNFFDLKHPLQITNGRCEKLSNTLPQATAAVDFSTLQLNISIPQAQVVNRPADYIPTSSWQSGVPAAFLSYDFNDYRYQQHNYQQDSQYLALHGGANLGGWSLRHNGTYSAGSDTKSRYMSQQTYLEHDITPIMGRLTVGDFSTDGTVMDAQSLRGIKIASDLQMLPQSERGFAPAIHGVANSNARVQVRQAGNIIYETTVPPGPFDIANLYSTSYGGDLQVTILEANGTSRTFTVPYASTSGMVRPGTYRYQLAAGRYRYGSQSYDTNVVQGTYQYGVNNLLTANGGLLFANDYKSGLLGAGFNLPYGALLTDVTLSQANIDNQSKKGYSLHAAYSITLNPTATYLTFAAYRYSSRNFYSLNDVVLRSHISDLIDNDIDYRFNSKSQYQVSATQPLPAGYGSFYVSAYKYTYWQSEQNMTQYQLGYNNSYKRLNYNIGVSKTASNYYASNGDTQIFFSISIPLGEAANAPTLSSTSSHLSGEGYNNQTTLTGQAGEERQYNYSVSSSMYSYQDNSYALSGGYRSPYATFTGSTSSTLKGNTQTSLGVSGGIVTHQYGVTLSNTLGDTFAIIHADHGKGAVMNDSTNNQLDHWGNGIYSYLTPYEYNDVGVDTKYVPSDVSFQSTQTKVVPRQNAIIMVKFGTEYGAATLVSLKRSAGDEIPMGAIVYMDRTNVGTVAQGGQAYLRNIKDNSKLTVEWDNKQCSFVFHKPEEKNLTSAGFYKSTENCNGE